MATQVNISLDKLICASQCAFVSKRQGQDNITVDQETFHSMRTKKGDKVGVAIKIDLEKVNDKLGWAFIKGTLQVIGFLDVLINLVWHYISNHRVKLHEEFSPSSGIS